MKNLFKSAEISNQLQALDFGWVSIESLPAMLEREFGSGFVAAEVIAIAKSSPYICLARNQGKVMAARRYQLADLMGGSVVA